jgi:hypothetical protein
VAEWAVPCVILVAAAHGTARADLVINEFLPDPQGSDGGREFVELMNPGPSEVFLDGVSIQFANGAEGAVWTTRWSGSPGASLAPGALFLIVDRNWLGEQPGQAEAFLGLQNGPDALRLVRGDSVLDMVGYGPLTDLEMMEESPVSIVPGLSVARKPDGWDTDDNGRDFVQAEPTPGTVNFSPFDLAVTGWELDPPSADRPGLAVRFSVGFQNEGTETFPVGPISLRFGGRDYPSLLDLMPPGAIRWLTWNLVPEKSGLLELEILVPLPEVADTLVVKPAALQVGPGELILNEVLAAPGHGQGEWLEITARGTGPVSLTGFHIRDEDGDWRPLPAFSLEPGDLIVLAQDSLALAGWHLDNRAHGATMNCAVETALARQINLAGWPSLNNSPPESRDFADRIYLSNPAGDVIDHVTLKGDSETGQSQERLAEFPSNPRAVNWAASTSLVGSTPGCPNSVSLSRPVPAGFTVWPRILDPASGSTTVHFLITLIGGQTGWDLRVFDLWGGLVRNFGGDDLGPGPRDLPWDGTDDQGRKVPPGGYVAVLQLRNASGQVLSGNKVLLAVQ